MTTSVVWHRGDLRTHDHPALVAAASAGPTVGVVILDDNILNATSDRRRALFIANVEALRASYERIGGALYVRSGVPWIALPAFIAELQDAGAFVTGVHALRSYSPYGTARDAQTRDALQVPLQFHDGLYVREPGTLHTKAGTPFSVYSPFLAAWRAGEPPDPLDTPSLVAPSVDVAHGALPTACVCDVKLPPAGETAALNALGAFLDGRLNRYADNRDRLDGAGSSRLSIWINMGVLSARTAAAAAWERGGTGASKFTAELAWRDFLADMLLHKPHLTREPFHERWRNFAWNDSESDFVAWRDGNTGVPAVDAAMRELKTTGWISNRARMVAAQFLTKHLRIHWTKGARVFHDWLLDGDVASNTGNWQWSAGLGIDNAPYFRVFNPVTQGKQHDPDGDWLRKWVPESNGSPAVMSNAIVDLADARREYLAEAEESS